MKMNVIDVTTEPKSAFVLSFSLKMHGILEETWNTDLNYFGRWYQSYPFGRISIRQDNKATQ